MVVAGRCAPTGHRISPRDRRFKLALDGSAQGVPPLRDKGFPARGRSSTVSATEATAARAAGEFAVLLSLAFAGLLAAGWALTVAFSVPPLLPPPLHLLGWVLVVGAVGSLARSAYVLSVRGRGTPYPRRPPKSLVITGPFARVRNPILLSWGALLFGLGVSLPLPGLMVLLVPAAVAIHGYVVYHEEPILARRFGADFEAYRRRVPRWIPRLRA